ncbi:2-oxoglutarate-dependent dioxygenase [Micromonospora pallida]|uniref:2-oxoglutarate-dependent dioxygenase n=1 Tax=Micromonospora pallida TaxID=145854 RepID=A0A1C6SD73_9ACTN|nr:phytanoyl-CoA dioxygenase family protein [Micromonospora pallida]SCL27319.1 2-oxoglutarate-dependent dioxygenase [Micromonospora pallida]
MEAQFLAPDDPGIGEALRRDGVVYIRDILDPEQVAQTREVLASYEKTVLPKIRRSSQEADSHGRLVMYRDVERYDPWLNDLVRQPSLLGLVQRAVDWDPIIYYLDVFPKPAGGTPIDAHQELYTVPVDPPQLLHLWIPLEDVTPENGSIHFYHGTHRLGLAPHVERPGVAPTVDPRVLDRIENMRVEVTCPAGWGAIFGGYMIHWSGPNRSDRDRPAMTIGLRGRHTTIKSEAENVTSLVARVFREETELPTYGWDDDFYGSGGNDEVAGRVLARIHDDHGVTIPLSDFSAYRTPRAMAARVLELQGHDALDRR